MALTIQNLDDLSDSSPELGEALQEVQSYINANVTAGTGNRVAPAAFLQGAVPVGGAAPVPVQPPPPGSISQDQSDAGGGGSQKGNSPEEQV